MIGRRDDRAVGVVRIRLGPPGDGEAIGLFAILNEGHGLRRLAESDRQDTRGERIERAGVTRLFSIEHALQPGDRMGRGHADRLVERDPAIDLHAGRTRRVHCSCLSFTRSRLTCGESRSASILAPSSKLSSGLKRTSGAYLRLILPAISLRRNFLWRSSASITASISLPPSGIT